MQEAKEDKLNNKIGALTKKELFVLSAVLLAAAAMLAKAFFGTELTDEAYYVADALGMLRGNLPYVYNDFSLGTGSAFLLIPPLWIYEMLVPDGEGVFLFSRISFLAFHLACIAGIYLLLKRHVRRLNAMLFALILIPFINQGIMNYSYNTIPAILFCLVALLLFDGVEDPRRGSAAESFAAGFFSGIAVFANPGYAFAVLFFLILIPLRSAKKSRLRNLLSYIAGGVLEILAVFTPLLCISGAEALWQGLEPMFTDKFPVPPQSSEGLLSKLTIFAWVAGRMAVVLTLGFLSVSALLSRKTGKKGGKEEKDLALRLTMALTVCFYSLLYLIVQASDDVPCRFGVLAAILFALTLLRRQDRDFPLLYYCGIYPILYVWMQVLLISTSDTVVRFWACLPVLFAILLLLLEKGEKPVRTAAFAAVLLCTFLQGYTLLRFPYRDAQTGELTARVESGVYKGIRTTPERARDLPELEEYLNSVVGGDERYAFLDNVPCAYLMMHGGQMCDISSWDVLNYSYGRNMPSKLFDYYRRRGAVPDVIVYIDIGRDPEMSIENEEYRFNDFVLAYYDMTEETKPNATFSHVMVFRYAGGFDGDIERWIEDYNTFPTGSEAA